MKVSSPHLYLLPGYQLPKGESEVGEIPEGARQHLDGLIAGGVVKVLDAPASVAAEPTISSFETSVLAVDVAPETVDATARRKRSPKQE